MGVCCTKRTSWPTFTLRTTGRNRVEEKGVARQPLLKQVIYMQFRHNDIDCSEIGQFIVIRINKVCTEKCYCNGLCVASGQYWLAVWWIDILIIVPICHVIVRMVRMELVPEFWRGGGKGGRGGGCCGSEWRMGTCKICVTYQALQNNGCDYCGWWFNLSYHRHGCSVQLHRIRWPKLSINRWNKNVNQKVWNRLLGLSKLSMPVNATHFYQQKNLDAIYTIFFKRIFELKSDEWNILDLDAPFKSIRPVHSQTWRVSKTS